MRTLKHILSSFFLLGLFICSCAQVSHEQISAQKFLGEIEINASQEVIWNVITDSKKVAEVLGYEFLGTAIVKLEKIGHHSSMKVWEDKGQLIVIYVKEGKELRFAWTPDNASYICEERWLLKSTENGTMVTYSVTYTDSGSQSAEDIKAQVNNHTKNLGKLKSMCE